MIETSVRQEIFVFIGYFAGRRWKQLQMASPTKCAKKSEIETIATYESGALWHGLCDALKVIRKKEINYANSSLDHFDSTLMGALPIYPYSTSWGYYPSGGLGLLLVLALIRG